MSDQAPPPPAADPAAARPTRPVKKVAKKRPAGSKSGTGTGTGTKARTAKKTPSGGAPPPVNDATATTRGFIVIGITVVVGLLVFWLGFKNDASEVVATGPTTTVVQGPDRDAAPPTTQPAQGTTIPSAPATSIPPAQVKVIVANSVDASQTIAGPEAAKLTAAGYPDPVTMDLAPFGTATSSVYYTGSLEPEAQAVAVALGLPDSAVNPIPTPAPTPMNTAQILVIIGQDAV